MFAAVTLILLALVSAMALAYGTHPNWAAYPHGIDLILWTRSLQWLLAGVSLAASLGLVALVIAGKRRLWWLVALGPVLALFVHRFATDPLKAFVICENPSFAEAGEASFPRDGDYVVGLQFGEGWYAYPFAELYRTPVVIQAEHDRRLVLMWSAFANRAVAVNLDRSLKARDLEIVSMPANALLLYNSRLGQFINGITGETMDGQKPKGFRSPVPTAKTTWAQWRAAHPQTKVMVPLPRGEWDPEPSGPLLPYYRVAPVSGELPAEARIAWIATTRPVAVPSEAVGERSPVNVPGGEVPVLLLRDASTGLLRAWDRRLDDLVPRFLPVRDPEHPDVALVDADTHTRWSAQGVAMAGPAEAQLPARRLAPFRDVDDDLYWGVMKFWYPRLLLYKPEPLPAGRIADLLGEPAESRSPGSRNAAPPRVRRTGADRRPRPR